MKKLNFVVAGLMMASQPVYAGSDALGTVSGMASGVAMSTAVGAAMNGEAGKKFMSKCESNPGFCVMGAMAFATVVTMAGSSSDATSTKKQVSSGGDDFNFNGEQGGGKDPAAIIEQERKRAEAALKDAAKRGYKADPKNGTLTDPKGKTHSMAALGSGKAMADAGLISPEDIPAIDKAIAEMRDKFKVVSVGVGGGGGGSSAGKTASYTYDDPYKNLYGNMGGEKPNAPRTSGLTRTLASGESIGSQSDNIFEMIRRRYQQKTEEKIFVGQDPANQ